MPTQLHLCIAHDLQKRHDWGLSLRMHTCRTSHTILQKREEQINQIPKINHIIVIARQTYIPR